MTDAPTRAFHWLFALCFVGAYLSAESERWRPLHVTLGYTFAGLLLFRLLYGWLGPRSLRPSAWWHKLQAGRTWWNALSQRLWPAQPSAPQAWRALPWRPAQNAAMAGAVLAMLALVLPLTLSGYATYNDWGGEWLEELHELAGNALLAVVLVHLGLIAVLSGWRRQNQASPMWSGTVPGPGPDLVPRNRLWLAGLLLAVVAAYWTWEWQQSPQGLVPTSTWSAGTAWQGGGGHGEDDD